MSEGAGAIEIAYMGFRNNSGESNLDSWEVTLNFIIKKELKVVKGLQVVSIGRCGFLSSPFTNLYAQNVSEVLMQLNGSRPRWVVWGMLEKNNHCLAGRVFLLATGNESKPHELMAVADDWMGLADTLSCTLIKALGISERERLPPIVRKWTTSKSALEAFGKALSLAASGHPWEQVETAVRKSIEIDSRFPAAYVLLAEQLSNEGKLQEAIEAAKQAIVLQADNSEAYIQLGSSLLAQGKFAEAEAELKRALTIEPGAAEAFEQLGELYSQTSKYALAEQSFKQALRFDPCSANIHAHLAFLYALEGKRQFATAELQASEGLNADNPLGLEQALWQGYANLHILDRALDHCRKFLLCGKRLGVKAEWLRPYEADCAALQARMSPTFFQRAPPKIYTTSELHAALVGKLSSPELALVVDPLTSTDQLKEWAQAIVKGCETDLQRAKAIFDVLLLRVETNQTFQPRTASEVFRDWNNPEESFQCQGYSYLYVALARAAGLQAFVVDVQEAWDGVQSWHQCAGVFTAKGLVLVDPTYLWFGAPHRRFAVLSDLQTAAAYLCTLRNLKSARVAAKLSPELTIVQASLTVALLEDKQWDDSEASLRQLISNAPDTWMQYYPKAILLLKQGLAKEACQSLCKAIEANPSQGNVYLLLGKLYLSQGQSTEARLAFESALKCVMDGEQIAEARRGLEQTQPGQRKGVNP